MRAAYARRTDTDNAESEIHQKDWGGSEKARRRGPGRDAGARPEEVTQLSEQGRDRSLRQVGERRRHQAEQHDPDERDG